jgi:NAD(P)-dependent dehydrogenase (short-subunit alcohol dehydrogenase family)
VRNDHVRVALVTGANRGLGFETACQLLAKGLVVVLAGRDIDALERARGTLAADDRGRAVPVQLDVTNVETISAARRAIGEQVGSVDVLVNNAALLLGESDHVLAISADDYRRTFETNLFGIVEVCRVFVPPMARAGYGRVVNVSSGSGQLATMPSYAPAYSMSKAALNAFTRISCGHLSGRRSAGQCG